LKRSCTGTAKSERDDFTCVGRSVGDEEAPRNALESLTDDKDLERVGLKLQGQICYTNSAVKGYHTKKLMKMVAFMRSRPRMVVQR
jgi:hypothetical protein